MDEKFEERTGEYEEREDHRLKHAGAIALFLLSPVFSYVMFEFVTGNFVMVLPKNAVLNIVWMFALYLLVFGISGSTRISVPVSSVILYASPWRSVCRFLQKPSDHDGRCSGGEDRDDGCRKLRLHPDIYDDHLRCSPDHMERAGAVCVCAGKRKKEKSSGIQRFCWCGCCVYRLLL